MTDDQIQANADRAHGDSMAMTAAINAQTEAIKAAVAAQQAVLTELQKPDAPRLTVEEWNSVVAAVAAVIEKKP